MGGVAELTALIAGLGFATLMFLTVLDIAMRQFVNKPFKGMLEYTEVWQPALVFLGMMGAQAAGAHARTPIVVNMLPEKFRSAVRRVGLGISTLLVAWLSHLAFADYRAARALNEVHMGVSRVPVSLPKLVLAIGLALFAAALLRATFSPIESLDDEDLGSAL